jgi:hypothetical protein
VEASYVDFLDAATLTHRSHLVVAAEYLSGRDERREVVNPVHGPTGNFQVEAVHSYRVIETIKGSLAPGSEIIVRITREIENNTRPGASITFEQVPAEEGKVYALFLLGPSRDAERYWIITGDPGVAEIVGNELRFWATDGYQERVTDRGLTAAPNSDAPFALTLTSLRQIAADLDRATPTPAPRPTQEPPKATPTGTP